MSAVDPVRAIADAVLYEGYLLWPYSRSALKNQRRWTFGGVYPAQWSAEHPDDRSLVQTQCLLEGGDGTDVEVHVRFLQVVRRQVFDAGDPVDEVVVAGERHLSWEEAVEREFSAVPGRRLAIGVDAGSAVEELGGAAWLVRSWGALAGTLEATVEPAGTNAARVTVEVTNETPADGLTREEALARTFCSTHAVLRAWGGEFVSLTDPPERLADAAAECRNVGTWPVLVGDDDKTMLSSPIILEDHARIAPESPGDLFDGGEVDQLLTLSILSLTEEERAEMRASDPRARKILERTEALTAEELMRLHGRLSDLRAVHER